jgi:uncharacterized membrane protein YiaA
MIQAMRTPNRQLEATLLGIGFLLVGVLFLAAAVYLVDPFRWQWCGLLGLAIFVFLLGTINVIEKWTDTRGIRDI